MALCADTPACRAEIVMIIAERGAAAPGVRLLGGVVVLRQ
jgi:hypothetical protein